MNKYDREAYGAYTEYHGEPTRPSAHDLWEQPRISREFGSKCWLEGWIDWDGKNEAYAVEGLQVWTDDANGERVLLREYEGFENVPDFYQRLVLEKWGYDA